MLKLSSAGDFIFESADKTLKIISARGCILISWCDYRFGYRSPRFYFYNVNQFKKLIVKETDAGAEEELVDQLITESVWNYGHKGEE